MNNVRYAEIYIQLFQLWLDEISISEHLRTPLDGTCYERLYHRYSQDNDQIPTTEVFNVLADDAFLMLDFAAFIHCNDLGEYMNIDLKRKEILTLTQRGSPFCKNPRDVCLVSVDMDLEYAISIYDSVAAYEDRSQGVVPIYGLRQSYVH